jgi:response regulator RpfG family c-di-GMP phosphodiesterase
MFRAEVIGSMLRPSYRERRSEIDALTELRRCAGTQFDPAIVEAFAVTLAARDALIGSA